MMTMNFGFPVNADHHSFAQNIMCTVHCDGVSTNDNPRLLYIVFDQRAVGWETVDASIDFKLHDLQGNSRIAM